MGKRQRRRNRHHNKTAKQQPTPRRYLYPNTGAPLLEVVFNAEVPDADRDLCLAYWEFTEPGTWSRKVAEIGPTTQVLRTVKASCHADLLTIICPDCAGPRSVFSRSDVTATRLWAPDVFPHTESVSRTKCQTCRDAEAAEQARQAERAAEEKQQQTRKQVEAAGLWLQEQADRGFPSGYPHLVGALTLLAMVEIMERTGTEAVGPLNGLNYTLTASTSTDVDVFRTLYQERWICPTTPATTGNFDFDDDGTVRGVYITEIPWRLAPALGGKNSARRELTSLMSWKLCRDADDLRRQVLQLQAEMAVAYLEGLLTRKYNEAPIPEHRLPDAYDTFLTALQEGFTLGQLVAIAWSATASSVAWGQRTPGLKPGSVSAAAVTNLDRRLEFLRDRRIDEYDLPNWVPRPAIYATALRVLEQHDSEAEALSRFRTMRQRTESRALEAAEFDGDMADLADDTSETMESFIEDLRAGRKRESKEPTITYALVTPGGDLEFHSEPVDGMRDRVGVAGAGVVDRIILPNPTTVHAYVAELVTASDELANPVADEMLSLLDCHDGPFYGPISFFGIGAHCHRPRSLDEDQQEMLRAAHEVARSRAGLS